MRKWKSRLLSFVAGMAITILLLTVVIGIVCFVFWELPAINTAEDLENIFMISRTYIATVFIGGLIGIIINE